MRLSKNDKNYRDRQAKFLLFWRGRIRWKIESKPNIHDASSRSGLMRATESEIVEYARMFGVTGSSFYRAIRDNQNTKSKWRRCVRCLSIFNRATSHGSECVDCSNMRCREYARKNPDKIREKSLRRIADPVRRASLYAKAKDRYLERKARGTHLDHKHKRKALMLLAYCSGERFVRPKLAKCHYCGVKVSGSNIHLDHVVPVSRGGAHASFNWVISCPQCNTSKHARMPNEFTPGGQLEMVLAV